MDVTNLSLEERKALFEKWLKDVEEYNKPRDLSDPYCQYLLFGHDVNITKEQLEDPDFVLLEWNEKLPDWMRKLAPKIGCRCKTEGEEGIFLGFTSSYEDFYYRIKKDNGDIALETCVSYIKFGEEEKTE